MNKCYTKGIAVLLAAFACMAQAGAAGTVEKDRPLSILPSLPQQLVSPPRQDAGSPEYSRPRDCISGKFRDRHCRTAV